ncbi:MAG: protein kinase [Deltaproteobacteria bacterium]|nr:protein kinase [Deltaproteobacteria bacterium]
MELGAGKYQVIAPISTGGMAEVFVAQAIGIQGFVKRVAIKRVLPHLAKEREFVRMFLDEARVAVELTHANIVQVLDLGVSDDNYFIVMEYIDGRDLGHVLKRARQLDTSPSIPLAIYIFTEVLKGLEHAHSKRDAEGRSLGVVHRDVSPANILLSWPGEVKIADFGIAKAALQIQLTDPGALKGKYSYMSPEQARGEPVDPRSDVFAAGIVLWEMIAGQRLFKSENNFETLERVKAMPAPKLHSVRSDVPPELSAIIGRALEKVPDNRYSRAGDMGDELAEFLYAKGWKVTASDLSAYLAFLFPASEREELAQHRQRLVSAQPPAGSQPPKSGQGLASGHPHVELPAAQRGAQIARGPTIEHRAPPKSQVPMVPVVTSSGVVLRPQRAFDSPADESEPIRGGPPGAPEKKPDQPFESVSSDSLPGASIGFPAITPATPLPAVPAWTAPPATVPNIAASNPSAQALELDLRSFKRTKATRRGATAQSYAIDYRAGGPPVEPAGRLSNPFALTGPFGFLIKIAVIGGLIFGGYRLAQYLSDQGIVGTVPGESRLIVLSNPPGAQIFLNNEQIGVTPFDGKNPVRQEKVFIRIVKDGFTGWEDYVTTQSRNNIKVDVKLMSVEPANRDRGK